MSRPNESSGESSDIPSGARRSDVLVVGGGVIGVASALELARRGLTVTVIERDQVGHACSFGNAGWLTPSLCVPLPAPGLIWKSFTWLFDPESPLYIQPRADPGFLRWMTGFLLATRRSRFEPGARAMVEICRWSVDAWERLAAAAPAGEDFGFQRRGLVSVHETRKGFESARNTIDLVAQSGVRFEIWSADEVRQREPAVVGEQIGAYFFPDDGHCEPYPAVRALAAEAARAGVRFVENAEVIGFARRSNDTHGEVTKLSTTRGDFTGAQIVLATGAWSEALAKSLDLRVPILGAKGYSLLVPRIDPHPTHSINLAERKVAINPHHDALRIAGTLELVRTDLSINQRRVGAIVRAARGMLNLPEPLDVRLLWRGLRPCTPDGLPMIGRSRGPRNVWLATGHQMTGLKTAPATGRLLAELMTGDTPSFDPHPFRADRY